MKTLKCHVLAMIIPLAVLLLSDCAPTSGSQPPVSESSISPALDRKPVSYRPAMDDPFDAPFKWEQSEMSESESAGFEPLELTFNEPEEPDAVPVIPLVVTGTRFPDFAIEDWPCDVVDAERKAAWISTQEPEASRHHATEDSVAEWMKSLR